MTVLLPKLAAMDVINFDFDEEDNLSSALGTETLAARDMIPEGFDNTPRVRVLATGNGSKVQGGLVTRLLAIRSQRRSTEEAD